MNNSEFSLYQQRGNVELSAAECIFPETKKPTGFPSCLLRSLPLLHALLHRQFGEDSFWQQIGLFGSECPSFSLKQVPFVELGCPWRATVLCLYEAMA